MARVDENKSLKEKVIARKARHTRRVKVALGADGKPFKRYGNRDNRVVKLEAWFAERRQGEKIEGVISSFIEGVNMSAGNFLRIQKDLNQYRASMALTKDKPYSPGNTPYGWFANRLRDELEHVRYRKEKLKLRGKK